MTPDQTGSPLMQMVPFFLIILVFYFLVLRPEKNKQNELKKKVSTLEKNDQIITIGGLHGTVVNIKPTSVIVRIDDNVKVEVEKDAVATIKNR